MIFFLKINRRTCALIRILKVATLKNIGSSRLNKGLNNKDAIAMQAKLPKIDNLQVPSLENMMQVQFFKV